MISCYDDWFRSKLNSIGDWVWTDTGVDVYLISDHPDIALGQALDFFVTIDAPTIREGSVKSLFDAGYNSPGKIVQMTKDQLMQVLGENGKKAYDGLRAKLSDLPVYVLMAASGKFGRGIGVRKLKSLYVAAQGDITKFNDYNFICSVEGFDSKTAQRIIDGKDQWNLFFTDIMEYVTLKPYQVNVVSEGTLTGQVFVLTGVRDKPLQSKIEDLGGTVADSYSKKVTCVIAKDPDENSSKLQKARKDGVKIISLNDAWEMIDE